MKHIAIIGTGMGASTVSVEGMRAIRGAQVLVGAKRMCETFDEGEQEVWCEYEARAVARRIAASPAVRIAVLVSGDTGFHSAATRFVAELASYDVEVIPGISSVAYLFAKCGRAWQDAALVSCHEAAGDLVSEVRRNRECFVLTGNNVPELAEGLCMAGFDDLQVTVGENLGLPGERIGHALVSELVHGEFPSLCTLLIDNPGFDARVRVGIPDGEFIRGDVPMTKAEIRAVTLATMGLAPTDVCYDIGCGTGSVSVEMALGAHKGQVYAMDANPTALSLVQENCRRFHVGNVKAIEGFAPGAYEDLPAPTVAFIGGSSGQMERIVQTLVEKNPHVRIVASAIALESACSCVGALESRGFEVSLAQVGVARASKAAGLHMMKAHNPIFIIAGTMAGGAR